MTCRDIKQLLIRWGNWATNEHHGLYWDKHSILLKRLPPNEPISIISCSDEDGVVIDQLLAKLYHSHRHDELMIVLLYYMHHYSYRHIAQLLAITIAEVRRCLHSAENYLAGALVVLNITLQMDYAIQLKETKRKFCVHKEP